MEEGVVDELDVLTLPRKIIYALFPNVTDQEELESLMEQIRLCLHASSGFVSPPEKNVGWVLAANLVNSLLTCICMVAELNQNDGIAFINSLKGSQSGIRAFFASLQMDYQVFYTYKFLISIYKSHFVYTG